MSADLRGTSTDATATGDQPTPADQPQPASRPSAPPVTDQAAGAEARRQKWAHLAEGSGQGSPRPDPPAQSADQPRAADQQLATPALAGDQAAGAEARRQKWAHLTEGPSQARPDPPARHPSGTDTPPTAGKPPPVPDTSQGTWRTAGSDRPQASPPEAHVLLDRRYPTLEEYQKVRHAQPPGEHVDARHPHNADHGPTGSPGPTDHGRAAGHQAHGRHAAGEARSTSLQDTDVRDGSGDGAAEVPVEDGGNFPAQPDGTLYQADFRGERLRLWTDGQGHWASEYKRADDALPIDHVADVRSRMGPEAMPATEWADGHAIEVTRDPKDGVWIPGLPGKEPDQAGDVLAGPDTPEEPRSRSRDLLSTLTREAEDVFDETKEVSENAYKLHHPPEGKAEVSVSTHGPGLESTPHETEVGGMTAAVLAASLAACMLGQKFHEWRTREKTGAGHASDG